MNRWLALMLLGSSVVAQNPAVPNHAAGFPPGVAVPAKGTVFVLVKVGDGLQVQPIAHAAVRINPHVGANFAKQQLTFMIAKPKGTFDIRGTKAQFRIRDTAPAIFVFFPRREEEERIPDLVGKWVILRAIPEGGHRIVAGYSFPRMGGETSSEFKQIACKTERMNDDWVKISPTASLEPGEYAAAFVPERKDLFADAVYDFGVDP